MIIPLCLLVATAAPLAADEQTSIVVTAPGGNLGQDDARSLDRTDLSRSGAPDLLGGIARAIAGASFSQAQSNPFEPNLVYRGFTASALQGTAQGLAVYVDGARFNQPFGDTVSFDLLPDAAIRDLTIKDTSPIFGLNALGGVVAIETGNGRTNPGFSLSSRSGSFGRAESEVAFGFHKDQISGLYVVQVRHDDGWRRHSPSDLVNGFADLGWDASGAGVHLKFIGADTDLTGNGPAPVELLAADRRGVFTYPDRTRNLYGRLSLHPWLALTDRTRLEGSLYVQRIGQRTLNGDIADIAPCVEAQGLLCLDDQPVTDGSGSTLLSAASVARYGLLNRSTTRTLSGGALVQLADNRPFLAGTNRLVIGFSHDRSATTFGSQSELGALAPDRKVRGLGPVLDQKDGSVAPVGLSNHTIYSGLFISDTLPVLPGLNAELGLRWNDARIHLRDLLGSTLTGDHRFTRLNLGVELDYVLSKAFQPRLGFAQSNRAPTPAELSCADEGAPCSLSNFFLADPPLNQVVAQNWEAGASGRFGDVWRMEWLLSGYRTETRDDIQFIAAAVRGRAFFRNVGKTRRQGLEFNASARRGPWTIRAGYALTDAQFRSAFALNSPDNPAAALNGQISVTPGDRLPNIPRHRVTLSASYDAAPLTLGADAQIQSGQRLLGDEANLQPSLSGFGVVGLHVRVQLLKSASLFAEVRNLFNARYATFGTFSESASVSFIEVPMLSNPRSVSPAPPRQLSLGTQIRF